MTKREAVLVQCIKDLIDALEGIALAAGSVEGHVNLDKLRRMVEEFEKDDLPPVHPTIKRLFGGSH